MSEKCNHVFGIFGKNEVVECVKCGLEVDQVDLITENAELRKRIEKLEAFLREVRDLALMPRPFWEVLEKLLESSDADNG